MRSPTLILALWLLCSPAFPAVQYQHWTTKVPRESIYRARVEIGKQPITTALGEQRAFGMAPLTGIVGAEATTRKIRPLVAVNGDYFLYDPSNYQGIPQSLQVLEGELITDPTPYPVLWFDHDGKPYSASLTPKFQATWGSPAFTTPFVLNHPRPDNGAALYTPTLGLSPNDPTPPPVFSTRTIGGTEYILSRADGSEWLPIQVGKSYTGKVSAVNASANTQIQKDQIVLSVGPQLSGAPALKVGDTVTFGFETTPSLAGIPNAIGTALQLVQDGKNVAPQTPPSDKTRAPRTMVGWNEKLLSFFVVDGHSPSSVGMTYWELAELALREHCTQAVSLDGGGSSTLWVKGKVVNQPSDGDQRSLGNALIVYEPLPANSPSKKRAAPLAPGSTAPATNGESTRPR
jgi:exopolysaccharide biosynthesis protein